MPKSCVVLLNSKFVPLGTLEAVLKEKGFMLDVIYAPEDDLSKVSPEKADLLIVLGGPQSPYQTEKYPYLSDEISIIKQRAAVDLPILGIAMGAQLIAAALGAKVYPGKDRQLDVLIDWLSLEMLDTSLTPELALFLQDGCKVLSWQNDGYQLGDQFTVLAQAGPYGPQAFQYGDNVLGFQFHAEVTEDILAKWLELLGEDLAKAGVSKAELEQNIAKYLPGMMHQASLFWSAWIDRVLGNSLRCGNN